MGSIGNDAFHAPLKQRLAAVVPSATRHWQLERFAVPRAPADSSDGLLADKPGQGGGGLGTASGPAQFPGARFAAERPEELAPALDPGEAVGRRECFRRRPDT